MTHPYPHSSLPKPLRITPCRCGDYRLPLGTRTILGVIYQSWRSRTASWGLWNEPGRKPGLLPWGTEDTLRIGQPDLSFLTCWATARVLTFPATSSPQGFSADLPPQESATSWETFEVSLYLKDKMLCSLHSIGAVVCLGALRVPPSACYLRGRPLVLGPMTLIQEA